MRRDVVRSAALSLAGPVAVVVVHAAAAATPGYTSGSDTVSNLASPGQPWALVVQATLVAYGVLLFVAPPAKASSSFGRTVQHLLLRAAGVAVVVTGLACKAAPGTPSTFESALHVAASVTAVSALTAAMALSVHAQPSAGPAAISGIGVGVTIVAAATFPFHWGGASYGAIERVILAAPMAWVTAMAAADARRCASGRIVGRDSSMPRENVRSVDLGV